MKKLKLIFMMMFGILLMTGCGKSIDVNKYLTVEVSGYDGYGTAEVKFDEDAFEKACEKLSFSKSDDAKMAKLIYGSVDDFLRDCIRGAFSSDGTENGKLSNGDSITYKLDLDDETAKEITGVSLKGTDITTKVKGLDEIETFDAFAFLEITYTGISPNGTASLTNLASEGNLAKLGFSADKTSGLANGDIITVSVNSANNANYMMELFGALPASDTKQYTVSGLNAYVSKLDEITSDCYDKMNAQGEDLMRAQVASNWIDHTDLHGIELIGNYLLTPKSAEKKGNYVYFIYKISALDHETGADFEYYWYVEFNNLIVLADGTVSVDLTSTNIPEHGGWFTSGEDFKRGGLSYCGYEDLDTLFNKKVTQYVGDWNYESTVKN